MINVNLAPCVECRNYNGVSRIKKNSERSEFIKCAVAREKNAKNLLRINEAGVYCEKFSSIEMRGG